MDHGITRSFRLTAVSSVQALRSANIPKALTLRPACASQKPTGDGTYERNWCTARKVDTGGGCLLPNTQ